MSMCVLVLGILLSVDTENMSLDSTCDPMNLIFFFSIGKKYI